MNKPDDFSQKKLTAEVEETPNKLSPKIRDNDEFPPLFRKERIDERSKFELAKIMLLIVLALYVFLVVAVLCIDPATYLKEVWTFSTYIINTTVAVVLGYYFGRREN
jgi:hypothetical protein